MGASIFTFIWLVSIIHNVDKSWALHSVDRGFLIELDAKCRNQPPVPAMDWGEPAEEVHEYGAVGATLTNASCVVDAVEAWIDDFTPKSGKVYEVAAGADASGAIASVDQPDDNFHTLSGLHYYENGANTSVITSLVFTTIAMLLGVANFIVLLVSSKRYMMLESIFCFCAGFGAVIVISSPWISDVVLNSAGGEFVALPVMVAFQITLLWVRPGESAEGIETQTGGFAYF